MFKFQKINVRKNKIRKREQINLLKVITMHRKKIKDNKLTSHDNKQKELQIVGKIFDFQT